MENLLAKKTLLKSVLSRGRQLLKIQKAHKREQEINKTNSLQKKLNKPLQDKIEKRLQSKLKPKIGKFENTEQDKVKANKQLTNKARRKAAAFKVREPKHNYIDRDMTKQKAMDRLLREEDF